MGNGIFNAVSGAVAETQRMEVVANNLANVSTEGFKADHATFAEVLSKAQQRNLAPSGSFVKMDEVRMDLGQGTLRPTEDKLDLSLEGPGYLAVADGQRQIYSRGGHIAVRIDGVVTDKDGYPLIGIDDKPLRVPTDAKEITVGRDGSVVADGGQVGKLKVVEFAEPHLLQRLGAVHYLAPGQVKSGAAQTTAVHQGFLENANLNPVRAVTSMVVASRTYEAFHTFMSTFSQIDRKAATVIGEDK